MLVQIFIDSRLAWLLRINSTKSCHCLKPYTVERVAGDLLLRYDLNRRVSIFEYIVPVNSCIEVLAHDFPIDLSKTPLLRQPLFFDEYRFVVDVNVGKLVKLLRMAGVDTYYKNGLSDNKLAEIADC